MPNRKRRYKQMEKNMVYAMLVDTALFVLFLLFSGLGIGWLKAITAILAILLAGLCLACLYLTRELTRPRSLWISVSFGAILICTLMSLILKYPCPAPKAAVAILQGAV